MVLVDDELTATTSEATPKPAAPAPRRRRVRAVFMRPRRAIVKVHRWTSIALFAWVVIVSLTGAWLVFHHAFESWLDPATATTRRAGDIGPQAATDAAIEALPEATPSLYVLTMPRNGRGVYQVLRRGAAVEGAPEPAEGEEPLHEHVTYFVDPGSGDGQRSRRRRRRPGVVVAVPRAHVPVAGLGLVRRRSTPRPAGAAPTPTASSRAASRASSATCSPTAWTWSAGCRCCSSSCCSPASTSGTGRACAGGRRRSSIKRGRGAFAFNMSMHKVDRLRRVDPAARRRLHRHGLRLPQPEHVVRERHAGAARLLPVDAARGRRLRRGRRARADRRSTPRWRRSSERYPDRAVQLRSTSAVRRDRSTYSAWVTRGLRPVDAGGRRRQHVRRRRPVQRARSSTTAHRRRATSSTRRGTTGTSRCTRATSAARRRGRCGRCWRSPRSPSGSPASR